MKYLVLFEQTSTGWSAYVPDLPGCVATAQTRVEIEKLMREGIEFHIEGMRRDGEMIPPSTTEAEYVSVQG